MSNASRTLQRACPICGVTFERTITGRGSVPQVCSETCREERERARQQARRVRADPCEYGACGRPKRSPGVRLCEVHYVRVRRHGDPAVTMNRQPYGVCHHCSGVAPGRQLFCSERCRRRNRLGKEGRCDPCATCGAEIEQPFKTVYCGETCLRLAARGRMYGLTARETWELLACGCSICGRQHSESGRRLHIDHDHETGLVRGLLCSPCNTGLGHFQDDPARLRAAAEYLRRCDVRRLEGQHAPELASEGLVAHSVASA